MRKVNRVITVLIFIFLYIPMIVLAVASFNKGMDIAVFKGFTFNQYKELFRDILHIIIGNKQYFQNILFPRSECKAFRKFLKPQIFHLFRVLTNLLSIRHSFVFI